MSARIKPPAHLNPPPMFGLRLLYPEMDDEEYPYYGDGWCIECNEEFHLDDCGGYNPPCSCGLHCRSCHEAEERGDDDYYDPYDDEGDR